MTEASIPVDLFNPGQVFACLGFLEAADVLLGDAVGGFDWSDEAHVRFRLRAAGDANPFAVVLRLLASGNVMELEPKGWPGGSGPEAESTDCFPSSLEDHRDEKKKWTRTKFPIRLRIGTPDQPGLQVDLLNWADGSTRPSFKLYSGNRSACGIARDMLRGKRGNSTKKKPETLGIETLWRQQSDALTARPFDVLTLMGGSFNFDPRGAWTALDAGYSPNQHKEHGIAASPVVEILAAWGLEHARPDEYETRRVRYGAWSGLVPPILARPAIAAARVAIPVRRFRFVLDLSGKNKVVTFAQEETNT